MKHVKGLTLIEVLVALAIVAIAMTAIIKATAQNIRATNHLETKTIATWVGDLVLNEVRLGIRSVPSGAEGIKATTQMLGNDWHWQATMMETPNKHIKKLVVRVSTDEIDNDQSNTVMQLDGYVYDDKTE